MAVRTLFLADPMVHTPFANPAFLDQAKCVTTNDPANSDIIVIKRFRDLTSDLLSHRKLTIAWTHEPTFTVNEPFIVRNHLGLQDVFVFSVWNLNVFTDNYYYGPTRPITKLTPSTFDKQRFETKRIGFFAKYSTTPLIRNGTDVSLYAKRSQLALFLHEQGLAEIHGRDWPPGVVVEDTRSAPNRTEVKVTALKRYPFSIALENSIADFYTTEKIWEAIQGYSLPLYHPAPALAGVFPSESFIDVSRPGLRTHEEIRDYLQGMSAEEYMSRLNACIDTYMNAVTNRLRAASRKRTERILISFLQCV